MSQHDSRFQTFSQSLATKIKIRSHEPIPLTRYEAVFRPVGGSRNCNVGECVGGRGKKKKKEWRFKRRMSQAEKVRREATLVPVYDYVLVPKEPGSTGPHHGGADQKQCVWAAIKGRQPFYPPLPMSVALSVLAFGYPVCNRIILLLFLPLLLHAAPLSAARSPRFASVSQVWAVASTCFPWHLHFRIAGAKPRNASPTTEPNCGKKDTAYTQLQSALEKPNRVGPGARRDRVRNKTRPQTREILQT